MTAETKEEFFARHDAENEAFMRKGKAAGWWELNHDVFPETRKSSDLEPVRLVELPRGLSIVQILVQAGLAATGKLARSIISDGAVTIDGTPVKSVSDQIEISGLVAVRAFKSVTMVRVV